MDKPFPFVGQRVIYYPPVSIFGQAAAKQNAIGAEVSAVHTDTCVDLKSDDGVVMSKVAILEFQPNSLFGYPTGNYCLVAPLQGTPKAAKWTGAEMQKIIDLPFPKPKLPEIVRKTMVHQADLMREEIAALLSQQNTLEQQANAKGIAVAEIEAWLKASADKNPQATCEDGLVKSQEMQRGQKSQEVHTLFAYTEPTPFGGYPGFVNLSRGSDGRVTLTVRSPGHGGSQVASIALPHKVQDQLHAALSIDPPAQSGEGCTHPGD